MFEFYNYNIYQLTKLKRTLLFGNNNDGVLTNIMIFIVSLSFLFCFNDFKLSSFNL